MQIFQSVDYLHGVALHLKLVQSLPSSEKFVKTLIVTKLEQNVYVFSIFKEMLKLDHMLMLNRSVNFDLTHQLLLCSAFSQGCLLHNLGRTDCFSFAVLEFIALSETSLPKKLALQVFPYLNFSIVLNNFFFDNCWLSLFHLR